MDAWPESRGEALHTQTFLGHPPSCAAALASLAVIDEESLVERAEENGRAALELLARRAAALPGAKEVRGLGLMLGVECDGPARAARAVERALRRGLLLLPSGDDGRVLSVTPPLTIEREVLLAALEELCACLA